MWLVPGLRQIKDGLKHYLVTLVRSAQKERMTTDANQKELPLVKIGQGDQ